jgi:hypothetical protein
VQSQQISQGWQITPILHFVGEKAYASAGRGHCVFGADLFNGRSFIMFPGVKPLCAARA